MRRIAQADSRGGRWGRISVARVSGVVRRGWEMMRGRSGREVVKRIMRVRGGMGGGVVEGIVGGGLLLVVGVMAVTS